MQENEFEKRLKDEMSEFRVRPSEVVWNKIEDELRKKKRRRVIFIFFLLAGLSVVGYSGYVLFTSQKQILLKQDIAKTDENKHENQKPLPTDDAKKISPVNELSDQPKKPLNTPNNLNPENKTPKIDDDQLAQQRRKPDDESEVLKSSTNINSTASKNNRATPGEKTVALQSEKNRKRGTEPAAINADDAPQKNIEANEQLSSEKKQTNAQAPGSAVAAIKKQEQKLPPVPPKSVKKTNSSLRWALEVSGGISQLSNKAFSFTGVNQQADALYVNTPGNNTGGNTGGFTVYYPPSEVARGSAFRAAVVGEMSISKRSSVSAGLGYAYYSNEIKTGSHKDSSFILRTITAQSVALNSYYQGSHVIGYKNKYHFIQVPINYQLQLNKGVKVPIVWNIGVSPAYLFSTNALVYDTASGGIYYKNKDAFNKFHLNLNTGISFRIGKPNKLQWSIGPEVSMDMTGLSRDSEQANASSISGSQKRYFIYGGLAGRVYLKKKSIR